MQGGRWFCCDKVPGDDAPLCWWILLSTVQQLQKSASKILGVEKLHVRLNFYWHFLANISTDLWAVDKIECHIIVIDHHCEISIQALDTEDSQSPAERLSSQIRLGFSAIFEFAEEGRSPVRPVRRSHCVAFEYQCSEQRYGAI